MKNLLTIPFLFAVLNYASALPNFDPFADVSTNGGTSYTPGAALAGNNQNVTNDWQVINSNVLATNPQPVIVSDNLSYPDLPVLSLGNSISNSPPLAGTGASARLNLRVSPAPSIAYYSFILKVTDISAVPLDTSVNNFIAGFSDTTGSQPTTLQRAGGRLVVKKTGSGYVLGVGKGTTTADYAYDLANVRSVGDVVFVVVSYERAGGATNVNLWVNPPSSSFGSNAPSAPVASVPPGVSTGDMNASGIAAFVLSCQIATSPSCIIDEVRVATNWGIVTGGNPPSPITINPDPQPRTVKVGDRVAFVAGVGGSTPAYQWRFNGTNITDATSAAYTIASAQTTNAGSYSVVVTNVLNARTSAPAALVVSVTPFQLYETNLIVVRVGDGAQTLVPSGNSVFLDQFTTNGTYLNSVFIPDSGSSALIEEGPDLNGSTLTGTALTRSADKRLMALPGYHGDLGSVATGLQNTTPAAVPRGIATIDSNSQITLAATDTNTYTAYFRGAATDGTNNFWGSGSTAGTYYFGLNAPAASVQTSFVNTRSVDIFNGNLYCLGSATGFNGLIKFDGLPTTDQGAVGNILTGFNSVNTTDFSVDSTGDLVYLTVGSSIQKWQFSGASWGNLYVLTVPSAARYLTVDYSGASPVIYVTGSEGQLFRIEDTGADSTNTTLAASGPNQLYKGIRFGPVASAVVASPILLFHQQGNDLILDWSGAFILQSATNVLGVYSDVSGATSPYTNSTASDNQRYFRLRN